MHRTVCLWSDFRFWNYKILKEYKMFFSKFFFNLDSSMNMHQNSGFRNQRHSGKLAIKCILLRNGIYSTFLLQSCYFTSDSAVHFLTPPHPNINTFSQYFHLLKLTDVHTLLLGCTVPKSFHTGYKLMLKWLLSYCHKEKESIWKKSPLKKKKKKRLWSQQVQIFYPKGWNSI